MKPCFYAIFYSILCPPDADLNPLKPLKIAKISFKKYFLA